MYLTACHNFWLKTCIEQGKLLGIMVKDLRFFYWNFLLHESTPLYRHMCTCSLNALIWPKLLYELSDFSFSAFHFYWNMANCTQIELPGVVCKMLFVSRIVQNAVVVIFNCCVAATVMSICRTHTIGRFRLLFHVLLFWQFCLFTRAILHARHRLWQEGKINALVPHCVAPQIEWLDAFWDFWK